MNNKGLIKEIFVMTLADAITAIAVFFFLVPSHTSISSISGLGIILTHFIPLPLSVITMVLNILLVIGMVCLICTGDFTENAGLCAGQMVVLIEDGIQMTADMLGCGIDVDTDMFWYWHRITSFLC